MTDWPGDDPEVAAEVGDELDEMFEKYTQEREARPMRVIGAVAGWLATTTAQIEEFSGGDIPAGEMVTKTKEEYKKDAQ